jgi:hypothetical protein
LSIALTINGTTYEYPETRNQKWGPDATQWASAVTTGMLQKAGGLFQLLAEVDFGTAYGVKSLYYKTRTAGVADAGQVRLARADVISWRNQAGGANLDLSVNSSDVLLFNGVALGNFVSVLDTNSIDLTLSLGVLSSDLKLSSAAATAGSFKATSSIETDGLLVQAPIATTSLTGFLSSTDWNTFNGKQAAGSYITALTGDGTAAGPGSAALTLATVNSNVGTFAASTVNAKGLVTAAANLSGDATTSGAALTLATVNSNVGSFGTASNVGTVTVNGKGLVTAASNTPIAITAGQVAVTNSQIIVGNGSNVGASVAMNGDITIGNTGVTAIGSNKVTNAMLAQISTATFKGRTTAGTGNVEDLTATQATALLNTMVGDSGAGGTKGLVPAPATGDATKFLNGAGAWSTPSGAGDVTGPASAVNNNVVFFNGTTGKIIKDSGLALSGSNSGDVSLVNSTNGLTISGQALTMAVAASGASGTVSATTQTFTGAKTFETQLIGKGTATNDSAAAGYIGEFISANGTVTTGNTQGTAINLASISLTAGDWDVEGHAALDNTSVTSPTRYRAGVSLTTATLETQSGGYINLGTNIQKVMSLPCGKRRISLSSPATVYLVAECSGASGTFATDTGSFIGARRVR